MTTNTTDLPDCEGSDCPHIILGFEDAPMRARPVQHCRAPGESSTPTDRGTLTATEECGEALCRHGVCGSCEGTRIDCRQGYARWRRIVAYRLARQDDAARGVDVAHEAVRAARSRTTNP